MGKSHRSKDKRNDTFKQLYAQTKTAQTITRQYFHRSTAVLSPEYHSTSAGVLRYFAESTAVLRRENSSTLTEILRL